MTVPTAATNANPSVRVALGISYLGVAYQGWQSQPSGQTVQDQLEQALATFADVPAIHTLCAGRTDAGVHGLMQVVHFDTDIDRDMQSWVRGTNRYLPLDVAVQWAREVPASFHSRASAVARRYRYVLLESPVRPSLRPVGWAGCFGLCPLRLCKRRPATSKASTIFLPLGRPCVRRSAQSKRCSPSSSTAEVPIGCLTLKPMRFCTT